MTKKKLFMEHTAIPAHKTSAEILSLLVQAGAREVLQQYDGKGKLTGLKFGLDVKRGPSTQTMIFQLPARTEPIFQIINGRRKTSWDRTTKADADREQAERVAWRQLYRWTAAQLALIETGMVEAAEVFLPYTQTAEGKTVWETLQIGADARLALPPGPEDESNVKQFERKP